MRDAPAAPERIWYNGVTQHSRELRHSPPEVQSAHPRIEYVRADTVRSQINAAREAALREVEAKLNSIDMRSCQFEWHPYTAGYIRSELEKAIALIRKGEQP